MATRRYFLKGGTLAGSGLYLAAKFGFIQRALTQVAPGGALDPYGIPRFVTPLFVPPVMPPTSTARGLDYYEVAVRQIRQQVLPNGMPRTSVWAYGSVNHAGTFHSPAPTFEARHGRVTRVKWINQSQWPPCRLVQRRVLRSRRLEAPADHHGRGLVAAGGDIRHDHR